MSNDLSIEEKQKQVKHYLNEIDKMHKRKSIRSFAVAILILGIIIVSAFLIYNLYNKEQLINHIPVTANDIEVSPSVKPLALYKIKESAHETGNGVALKKVTIDNDSTIWTKDEVTNNIGEQKQVETEIYELRCTNTQKYKFSKFLPNTIVFRRYSVKGENNFTEEDIATCKEIAASYFTYKKYTFFNYPDKFEWVINVDTSNILKDTLFRSR